MVPIINNFIKNDDNDDVKNSFEVTDKISHIFIAADHIFISIDVVSLLANVRLGLLIEAVIKYWDDLQLYTALEQNNFISLNTSSYSILFTSH